MNVTAADGSETQLPVGLSTLNTCLNELKLVTRRYSKRQQKWINNRLLACHDRDVPDIYELDTSDVNQWQNNVHRRAVTIIDSYLMGDYCEMEPLKKRIHPGAGLNQEAKYSLRALFFFFVFLKFLFLFHFLFFFVDLKLLHNL